MGGNLSSSEQFVQDLKFASSDQLVEAGDSVEIATLVSQWKDNKIDNVIILFWTLFNFDFILNENFSILKGYWEHKSKTDSSQTWKKQASECTFSNELILLYGIFILFLFI